MIKGAQKRMIVIKTSDSRMFEEAYFVMRGETVHSNENMVSEANRIIESCTLNKKRERRKGRAQRALIAICSFMGGSAVGSLVVLAVMLVMR